jgi:leucyl-tRNA synthetase
MSAEPSEPGASPSAAQAEPYDWRAIEARWQELWRAARLFDTPKLADGEKGSYVFAAYPFTSGSIHVGHVRSYTLADAHARFRRARGEPVLFSMAFDSFGLPTELAAIKREISPLEWVEQCSAKIREQLNALGYSLDWEREFATCEPRMYRWSQFLFLTLLEAGLIYERESTVDWCDSCETVLARAETEGGECWRCHNQVRLTRRMQWFLRSSAYLTENDERLSELTGWNKAALGAQRAFFGRVDGVELPAVSLDGKELTLFTPHADAIAQGSFVALALNHPELGDWLPSTEVEQQVREERDGGWRRADRGAAATPAIDTGLQVSVAGVERVLPVVVSSAVDARFGPTAILAIAARDAADAAVAERLTASAPSNWRPAKLEASPRPAVRYAAQDYPVSRQRAWGSPLPIVHCERCGTVPVPVSELPVALPENLRIRSSGNALSEDAEFLACECPRCGGAATRDTDTLDCHFDGLWIWMALTVPGEDRAHGLFSHPDVRKWLPAAQIVWGMDGGVEMAGHRTTSKMLRDRGIFEHLPTGEPYTRVTMHGMVTMDGQKMSKHLGNVADPDELMSRVGADTLRFTMLYAAAPRNGVNWTEEGLDYCHRFLQRLWAYAWPRLQWRSASLGDGEAGDARRFAELGEDESPDKLRRMLRKWCEIATEKIANDFDTLQLHRATRNTILLLTRIEDFERRALEQRGALEDEDRDALALALARLVQLLAPMAPHMAEELWAQTGHEAFVSVAPWPTTDVDATVKAAQPTAAA